MKKQQIIFKNIEMNGDKDQERWFAIMDLLDEIYPDNQKIELIFEKVKITKFFFIANKLPQGTLKRIFAQEVLKRNKGKYTGTRNKGKGVNNS